MANSTPRGPRLDVPTGTRRTWRRDFSSETFGKVSERVARFIGSWRFIAYMTVFIVAWVLWNMFAPADLRPDNYPFIFLTLLLSLQASYAAPLILLAQTRQADRDKAWSDADARHREDLAQTTLALLKQNTELTAQIEQLSREVRALTGEIHQRVITTGA